MREASDVRPAFSDEGILSDEGRWDMSLAVRELTLLIKGLDFRHRVSDGAAEMYADGVTDDGGEACLYCDDVQWNQDQSEGQQKVKKMKQQPVQ